MLASFSIHIVAFSTHHQTQARPLPRRQSQTVQFPHLLNLHVHDILPLKHQILLDTALLTHHPKHSSSSLNGKRKGQPGRGESVGELLRKGICRTRMHKRSTGIRRRTLPSEYVTEDFVSSHVPHSDVDNYRLLTLPLK